MRNSFGEILIENKKIANLLNYKFSKLGDVFQRPSPRKQSFHQVAKINDFSFRFITKHESLQVRRMLNPSKPLRPTTLPAWALSDSSANLARPFTELFNAHLKEEKFHSELNLANVIPLYKKVKIDSPTKYRQNSITPALSKIFEKLYKALMEDYFHAR